MKGSVTPDFKECKNKDPGITITEHFKSEGTHKDEQSPLPDPAQDRIALRITPCG